MICWLLNAATVLSRLLQDKSAAHIGSSCILRLGCIPTTTAKLHSEHAILMAECSFASHCNFGMFVMLQGLQFTCLLNNYWLPSTDANMSTWCLHLVYELCIHVISFYSVLILSSTKAPTFSALDLRDTLVVTIVCSRSQFIWSFMLYCVWI